MVSLILTNAYFNTLLTISITNSIEINTAIIIWSLADFVSQLKPKWIFLAIYPSYRLQNRGANLLLRVGK